MNSTTIKRVKARQVIDTRAEYTIEVQVETDGSGVGICAAPRGAPMSRGEWEPPSYPEGGIEEAIKLVHDRVGPSLKGMDARNQQLIDSTLHKIDGTSRFKKLGANTSTAVSIAVAKAAAATLGLPLYRYVGTAFSSELPVPLANIIGGGPHSREGKAPDFQEHMVIPMNAKSMTEVNKSVILAYRKARELCLKADLAWTGGKDDEGAWVPSLTGRKILEILTQVAAQVESETGVKMRVGVDCAIGRLWDQKKSVYRYPQENVNRDPGEQIEYISDLISTFPLYYVEDFVHNDDYDGYVEITKKFGHRILVCGDDLFACNIDRLWKGIEMGAANSLIIKVNMAGTLTDTYRVVELAHKHGYIPVKSCRSGETEDTTITHLSVAWNCPFSKFAVGEKGAAKVNELIRIEEDLGFAAKVAKSRIGP